MLITSFTKLLNMARDVFKNNVNADKIKSFKTFSYDWPYYKISYIKVYCSGCVKK